MPENLCRRHINQECLNVAVDTLHVVLMEPAVVKVRIANETMVILTLQS